MSDSMRDNEDVVEDIVEDVVEDVVEDAMDDEIVEDTVEEEESDEDSLFVGKPDPQPKEPLDPSMDEEPFDLEKYDEELRNRLKRQPRKYKMNLRYKSGPRFKAFSKPIEPLPDYEDEEEDDKGKGVAQDGVEDLVERLRNVVVETSGSKSKKRSLDDDYEDRRANKKANTSAAASRLAEDFLANLENEILGSNADAVESAAPVPSPLPSPLPSPSPSPLPSPSPSPSPSPPPSPSPAVAELEAQNGALTISLESCRSDLSRVQDELQDERRARSRDNQLLNDGLQRINALEGQVQALESDVTSKKWEIGNLAENHRKDTQALQAAQNDLHLEKERQKSSAAEISRLLKQIEKTKKEAADERDRMEGKLKRLQVERDQIQGKFKRLQDESQDEIEKRDQAKAKADEEASTVAENARIQGAQASIDAAIAQRNLERMTNERDAALRERDQILRDVEHHLAQAGGHGVSSLPGHIQSSLVNSYELRYQEAANRFSAQEAAMLRENSQLRSLLSEAEKIVGRLEQEKTTLATSKAEAEQAVKENELQCKKDVAESKALFGKLFDEKSKALRNMYQQQNQQQQPLEAAEGFSKEAASSEQESVPAPIIHQEESLDTESSLHQELAESKQRLAKMEKELAEVKKKEMKIQNATAQKLDENPADCNGCRRLRDEIDARNQELAAKALMIEELKRSAKLLSDRALEKTIVAGRLEQMLNASEKQAQKEARVNRAELKNRDADMRELEVELKQLSDENRFLRLPENKVLVEKEGKAMYVENQKILDIAQSMLRNASSTVWRYRKSEKYMKQLLRESMGERSDYDTDRKSCEYAQLRESWEREIDTLKALLTPEQKRLGHAIDFEALKEYSESLVPSPELGGAKAVVHAGKGAGEGTSKELTKPPAEHALVAEALVNDDAAFVDDAAAVDGAAVVDVAEFVDDAAPAEITSTSDVANLPLDVKYLESSDPAPQDTPSTSEDSQTSPNHTLLELVEQQPAHHDVEREPESVFPMHTEMHHGSTHLCGDELAGVVELHGVLVDELLSSAAVVKKAWDSMSTSREEIKKLNRMVEEERQNAHTERRNARISWTATFITYFMLTLYLMRASIGSAFSPYINQAPAKVNFSLNNEQNDFCFAEYLLHTNTTDLIDPTTPNGVCYGQHARVFINKTVTITVPSAKLKPSTSTGTELAVVALNIIPDTHRQYGLFETPVSEFNTTRAARLLNAAIFFGSMGMASVAGWKVYRSLRG